MKELYEFALSMREKRRSAQQRPMAAAAGASSALDSDRWVGHGLNVSSAPDEQASGFTAWLKALKEPEAIEAPPSAAQAPESFVESAVPRDAPALPATQIWSAQEAEATSIWESTVRERQQPGVSADMQSSATGLLAVPAARESTPGKQPLREDAAPPQNANSPAMKIAIAIVAALILAIIALLMRRA